MVASSITVDAIYLDSRTSKILVNSVATGEDDTVVKISDNGLVETNERWDRTKQAWDLSYSTATSTVENLFKVQRQSRGFIFISSVDLDRVATAQVLKNTATGLATGDGSTTTFQLQVTNSTSAHSVIRTVYYPITGTVVAYKDAVAATVASVNLTTGVITYTTAPANGAVPTADFEYGWPARFTSSTISKTYLQVDQVELRSVQIEEIF